MEMNNKWLFHILQYIYFHICITRENDVVDTIQTLEQDETNNKKNIVIRSYNVSLGGRLTVQRK